MSSFRRRHARNPGRPSRNGNVLIGGPDSAQVCHDSIGLPTAHTSSYLPDGETSNGRETWTLVQNFNVTDVAVMIRYLTSAGVEDDVRFKLFLRTGMVETRLRV